MGQLLVSIEFAEDVNTTVHPHGISIFSIRYNLWITIRIDFQRKIHSYFIVDSKIKLYFGDDSFKKFEYWLIVLWPELCWIGDSPVWAMSKHGAPCSAEHKQSFNIIGMSLKFSTSIISMQTYSYCMSIYVYICVAYKLTGCFVISISILIVNILPIRFVLRVVWLNWCWLQSTAMALWLVFLHIFSVTIHCYFSSKFIFLWA